MGKVVPIQSIAEPSDKRIFKLNRPKKFCAHKLIEVDVDEREIRCRKCQAKIDSFDWIVWQAQNNETDMLTKEIVSLTEQKERLQRDLSKLKSELKYLVDAKKRLSS
jgi:hypothetical protein